MSNTKIVLNRQSDLILNNAQIVQPTGIEKTDLPGLVDDLAELNSAIDTEELRARDAETKLAGELFAESDARIAGDLSLQTQIDAILDGSTVDLDQFAEVVNFVQGIDLENDEALLGAVLSIETKHNEELSTEESARIAADASLAVSIFDNRVAVDNNLDNLEDNLRGVISTEESARIADVDAEESRAIAAEESLDAAKLDLAGGTMSGSIQMDGNAIQGASTVEGSTLITDAIDALTGPISMYGQYNYQGYNGVTNLGAPVNDGDATNKLYVDSSISSEESARIAGDEALAADLSDLQSYVDTTVDSAISTLTSDLSTETSARIADVDAEESRAIAAETSLNTALTQETSERIADVDAEEARALAAELILQESITAEASTRLAADDSIELFISTENSIMNNLIDFRSNSLETSISTEQSRIDVILEGSTTDLDQFAEIVTYINNLDLDNDNTVLSSIVSLELAHNQDTSIEMEARIAGDASIQSELDAMPSTDNATIEIDPVDNVIRLKDVIAATDSGVRTFEGDVKAGVDPSTLTSYDALSYITKGVLDVTDAEVSSISADLSNEVARAIGAESSIQEQLDAMPSTDNATIEVDAEFNTIRLTENVAAPLSGVRTFNGDLKAAIQPNDLDSYDTASYITKGILDVTDAEVSSISAELSTEAERALAAEAGIQAQLDAMPSTDNATLEVDGDSNIIKLKDVVAAPLSGVRTFVGDVKASVQPDTLESYDALSYVTKGILDDSLGADIADLSAELSAEIARAQDAEGDLDVRISDIISNTDLTSVDSFTELIDKVNEVTATNFDSIYAKKVEVTFNSVDAVTLATPVKAGSMMLFINGLMVDNGDDYTEIITNGFVTGATLIGDALDVTLDGAKLNSYGVHGSFSNITF